MALSVIDPVSPAIERTKDVLFRPFDLGKWLRLGFCAFLMGLAQGGGGGGNGGPSGGGGGDGGLDFEAVLQWLREHLTLVIVIVVTLTVLAMTIWMVLAWLSSRGHLMFLDGVVQNRGAVVEPWREFRGEGNSLFWFRFWLGWAALAVFVVILGLSGLLALLDIEARRFGGGAIAAIVFAVVALLAFGLLMVFIGVLLADFVVPIMYLRRISAVEAWRTLYQDMLTGNGGMFVLYFLFKILIGICVGVLSLAAVCLTCCLAAIPYVGTVILLPLLVFVRCYSLYFIEQFGPQWHIFPPDKEPPAVDTY
jgi:hypothetical protein